MKRTFFLSLLLLIGVINAFSQNYPNIVNYSFNGTPAYGVKIKTNLPFQNSSQMPTIKIEGYNFSPVVAIPANSATLNLDLVWYILNNQFVGTSISSSGGSTPNVWLSNENGKVVIFLDQKIYFQRFTISAFAQGLAEKTEYFQGWTIVDEALSGNQQKQVLYKNIFAGNVGVGTENPQAKLDVNGDVYIATKLKLGTTDVISGWNRSFLEYAGEALIIGPAKNVSRPTVLDIVPGTPLNGNYNSRINLYVSDTKEGYTKRAMINTDGVSFFNGGNVGIGTENPQAKLDVRGTISATEVKVQVLTGADYVFNPDYELKPLSEVEAFVKENKHLPEVPSEKQMQENGLNMNEFQIKLLQKIEELTLYTIELEKRIKQLEN